MNEPVRIEKTGRFWYFVDNLVPAEGEEPEVRLWMALPFTRPGQEVTLGSMDPAPAEIVEDALGGNRIACFEVRDLPTEGPLVVTIDFSVTATEVRTAVDPNSVEPFDTESPEFARFTRSEPWLETTDEIAATARETADGEANPYLAARRIFDWVVREMSYEYPHMEDRGAAKSFARRKGDCGEFSAVFVSMCRSLGIPARTVTCNWFTGFGHQWAEFLCPPYGWIPVDASVAEAMRRGEMREFCENRSISADDPDWLFGNLYASRLVVFVGTNLTVRDRTFQLLQPTGAMAWPEAFEARGFAANIVHAGFYLFDEGCDDRKKADERAKRELAKSYFDAGLPAEAEPGFRLIVAEEPKNTLAWFHLGQILMNRGELAEAREEFANCMAGEGGSFQPVLTALSRLLRGHCFDLEGMRDEALGEYEAVIESGIDFQDIAEQARRYVATQFTGEEE